MYAELIEHLQENIHRLSGDWLSKHSAYEADICHALDMQEEKGRYWDAKWNHYLLEFKKGRSIWLDLVRYSEIMRQHNEDACKAVLSLFFIPDQSKQKIVEVIGVETCALIARVKLTEADANTLIELKERVPRSLNAQASLTVNDLKQIKEFSIHSS